MQVKNQTALRLSEHLAGAVPTLGPESVGIVPTNACNLNCITCWSYSPLLNSKPNIAWKRQQLDPQRLISLINDLADLGTRRLIFTGGGDPLAYPFIYESIEHAKSKGLKITLISNLTLVRDWPRFLDLKIDTVQANFSAADAVSYVAFHPNRKEHEFQELVQKLHQLRSTGTELKLVFVVCKANFHLLRQLAHIAGELDAGVQLKLMSTTGGTERVAITDENKKMLLDSKKDIDQSFVGIKNNLEVFWKELSGDSVEHFPIDEVGCFAGHFYSRIRADGEVSFCCNPNKELSVGNINKTSFPDIWLSENYQHLRRRLAGGDFVEGCAKCGKFDLNYRLSKQSRSDEMFVRTS